MVPPEKSAPDPNQEVSLIKETTEEKALDIIEEDLDGELLIESDGDFFWVLQRVVWGMVKGLMLLGTIGIAVWFIWGGSDAPVKKENRTKRPVNKEVVQEKEIAQQKFIKKEYEKIVDSSIGAGQVSQYALGITQKSYELDQQRIIDSSDILSQSILWLKKAKALGEISTEVLRMEESVIRAQKIESAIVNADEALAESAQLQSTLSSQIDNLFLKKSNLEERITAIGNELFFKISHFDSNGIENLLAQKIKYQQDLVVVSEEGKVREILLKNIKNFDLLLRSKKIPLVKPTEMVGRP